MISEQSFYELVKAHDLSYAYSDDQRIYRRGKASLAKITEAAAQLPPDVAARLWNSVVDIKLAAGAREDFYWKVPASAAS